MEQEQLSHYQKYKETIKSYQQRNRDKLRENSARYILKRKAKLEKLKEIEKLIN